MEAGLTWQGARVRNQRQSRQYSRVTGHWKQGKRQEHQENWWCIETKKSSKCSLTAAEATAWQDGRARHLWRLDNSDDVQLVWLCDSSTPVSTNTMTHTHTGIEPQWRRPERHKGLTVKVSLKTHQKWMFINVTTYQQSFDVVIAIGSPFHVCCNWLYQEWFWSKISFMESFGDKTKTSLTAH